MSFFLGGGRAVEFPGVTSPVSAQHPWGNGPILTNFVPFVFPQGLIAASVFQVPAHIHYKFCCPEQASAMGNGCS